MSDYDYGNVNVLDRAICNAIDQRRENEFADKHLRCLSERHNDYLSPLKTQYRFSDLTTLDVTEMYYDPVIIRLTTSCSRWPCDIISNVWFKTQVFFAKKCQLPCCKEYTHPHVWARHRWFNISKRTYLTTLHSLAPCETDAILKWSDLVCSQEWQDGNWNERGILAMSDGFKFRTKKVSWIVMEDHLTALSYSEKKPLVLLAARICMESLAKNKALYTYSHQYSGFAHICVDMLKSSYQDVQEGILTSLQLYLRTLKIFHCCFSHKCMEYASSGLFPVLLNLLGTTGSNIQAMIINILVLMAMNAPYISLIVDLGGISSLITLASTDHQLLNRRVHACLEIVSRYEPTQDKLIEEGILPLAVKHFSESTLDSIQLNCLFILNSLCNKRQSLDKVLDVNKYLIIKSTMRMFTDLTINARLTKISPTSSSKWSQSLSNVHDPSWCTLSRQNLILICKLCIDEKACKQMVKKGLILKLKAICYTCDTEIDQILVMEILDIMSHFPRPAAHICQEGLLPIFADKIQDKEYQEHILNIIFNLGKKYLEIMLVTGLVEQMIHCFENRTFERTLYPLVLSILASFSANDKLQDMILANDGKVFTLVLDAAFLTSDVAVLQSCVIILSRLNTTVVPLHLLSMNTLYLVAYIERLLKTGPDDLILHGLLQLQDYINVDFLHKAFLDNHFQTLLTLLCTSPYTPQVQLLSGQILDAFIGTRSRRSSIREDNTETIVNKEGDT